MTWIKGSPLDLWTAQVQLAPDPAPGHFGQPGRYIYRYQLLRSDGRSIAFWFPDPFARETAIGTLSAFTIDLPAQSFPWSDAPFVPPEIDEMVVYEVNVREFNTDFDGLTTQLDYVKGLGVNVLELMPISNVKEAVEWGYTPLDYFAPDERLGGPLGFKRLVNAAHGRGMAVILDSVYAHTHPEFTYNLVYEASGEPNPMLGRFEGEFFQDWAGTDFRKAFTRDYFLTLNKYLIAEYHVDGFRYDYVPGMYDGPAGQGYADLVYRTYQHSKSVARFQAAAGRSRIIQCAEHLPDAAGIMSQTHSNCAWQNGLLDRAREMARGGYVTERLAHQLDPEFLGYPTEHTAAGDTFPVAPFQYFESHDHGRFVNQLGTLNLRDLLGERYGNRDQSLQDAAVRDCAVYREGYSRCCGTGRSSPKTGAFRPAASGAIYSNVPCTGSSFTTKPARHSSAFIASWERCDEPTVHSEVAGFSTTTTIRRTSSAACSLTGARQTLTVQSRRRICSCC